MDFQTLRYLIDVISSLTPCPNLAKLQYKAFSLALGTEEPIGCVESRKLLLQAALQTTEEDQDLAAAKDISVDATNVAVLTELSL